MNTGYKHRIRDKEMIKTVLPRTSFMYSFFTINTESINITFSNFTQCDLKLLILLGVWISGLIYLVTVNTILAARKKTI